MTPRPRFRVSPTEILILLVIAAILVTIAIPRLLSHRAAAAAPLPARSESPS